MGVERDWAERHKCPELPKNLEEEIHKQIAEFIAFDQKPLFRFLTCTNWGGIRVYYTIYYQGWAIDIYAELKDNKVIINDVNIERTCVCGE